MVLGAEYVRQIAMPANVTTDQEQIAWTMGERFYQAYMAEKLSGGQLLGLMLTWKGTTEFLGWGTVAPSLDPALRGPLAYVLGHRYELRLKQPAAALRFFETAQRDAPANSMLKRLAETEAEPAKNAGEIGPPLRGAGGSPTGRVPYPGLPRCFPRRCC